jgi:hypothetical protein
MGIPKSSLKIFPIEIAMFGGYTGIPFDGQTQLCKFLWPPWPRFLLFGSLEMLLVRVDERLQRHSHVLCKVLSGWVELHHTTASVVLGMPNDPWKE